MVVDGGRRDEILEAAAGLFGTLGLRASLHEVATAVGIQQASLYHHFDSKDAIYIELVARYRADLGELAERLLDLPHGAVADHVVHIGSAVAECAARHRAALLLTLYQPPAGSSVELVGLAGSATDALTEAFVVLLGVADKRGELRTTIDPRVLAEQLTASMLHTGVGVYHRTPGGRHFPAVKSRILLHGIAVDAPADAALDRSPALASVEEVVCSWVRDTATGTARRIRDAARTVFGRHGYEVTTIRAIAAEAGLSAAGVYRHIDSKQQLYASLMDSYTQQLAKGWDAIMASASTPIEKLDALLWLGVNLNERFGPEHRMQAAGTRYRPPTSPDLGQTFPLHIGHVKQLLRAGARAGELQLGAGSSEVWARGIYASIWMPERILRRAGLDGSLRLARETVLRGAFRRCESDD